MKKLVLLFLFAQSSFLFSQTIPNSGFETWVTDTESPHNYQVPQGWVSYDVLINSYDQTYTASSVVRTTQSHSGLYAALLQTVIGGSDTVGGILISTNSITNFFTNDFYGFSCTTRPAFFQGYYKFTSVSGDIAFAGLTLTKWNTTYNKRDTLLRTYFFSSSNTSSYTQFSVPLTYTLNEYPDTASINAEIGSTSGATTHVGTQFYLDDLSFSGSVPLGIEQFTQNNNVIIYPNPSTNNITIQSGKELGVVVICNSLGEIVFQDKISDNKIDMDITKFAAGIYSVHSQNTYLKFVKE